MELTRLKGRLRTAQRGHKLLKDKRDELMKQFMEVVREDLALRQKVEQSLARAYGSFTVASALMSPEMLEQALLCPKQSVSLETGTENVMSVEVPRYEFKLASEDGGNIYPYGFAQTSGELDDAVRELGDILPDLLRLAEVEKATQLLAAEIERTRRRVNALEYVKIPQMQQSIKYITMKLDENERANTIRLMKVKDIILKEAIEERRETDKAIADVITLNDEVIDDEKPYTIFDPNHTWKRKTVENFRAVRLRTQLFKNGECLYQPRALSAIRAHCLAQVDTLWEEVTRFENPHSYYVDLSQKLWDEKNRLLSENQY